MSLALHEQGVHSVTLSHHQAVLSYVLSTTQLCVGASHNQREQFG